MADLLSLTHKIDFQSLQKEVSWVLVVEGVVVMVSSIRNILLGIRSHQQMLSIL